MELIIWTIGTCSKFCASIVKSLKLDKQKEINSVFGVKMGCLRSFLGHFFDLPDEQNDHSAPKNEPFDSEFVQFVQNL